MLPRSASRSFAVALLFATAIVGPARASDQDICFEGRFSKNEEDPRVRIEACTRLINQDGDWIYWSSRGDIYREHLRQYELAIRDYTQVIALKSDSATSYFNRGASYEALGRNAEAIRDYRAAARYGSGSFRTQANGALQRLGAPPVTAEQSRTPDDIVCGGTNEAPQREIAACTRLIDRGAENAYYWRIRRGHVYKDKLRQYARAITDYTAAIAMRPQEGGTYLYRASSYEALGRRAEAIRDYRMVVTQLGDEGFGIHAQRALARLGDRDSPTPGTEAPPTPRPDAAVPAAPRPSTALVNELRRKANAREQENGFCSRVPWTPFAWATFFKFLSSSAVGGSIGQKHNGSCGIVQIVSAGDSGGNKCFKTQALRCDAGKECTMNSTAWCTRDGKYWFSNCSCQ